MRQFVYHDAKSHKFWHIELGDKSFTVVFGRVGSKGQTRTRTFAYAALARKEHDKRIAEKLAEGYVETTPPSPVGRPGAAEELAEYKGRTYRLLWCGPTAYGERAKLEFLDGTKQFWVDGGSIRRLAGSAAGEPTGLSRRDKPGGSPPPAAKPARQVLEEALAADPDDRAAHAAYADLLQEEGDPRGEFISVQLTLEDESKPPQERERLRRREQEILAAHERAWLGELARFVLNRRGERRRGGSVPQLSWARGRLDAVRVPHLTDELAEALAHAPAARTLRHLEVWGSLDAERLSGAAFLATLRNFQLGWAVDPDPPNCRYTSGGGSLDEHTVRLIGRLPRLEELRLYCPDSDADLLFGLKTLVNLRVLYLFHLWNYPLEKLAANPAFARLEVLFCHPREPVRGSGEPPEPWLGLEHLRAVVRSPHLKNLSHLHLRLCGAGDAGCREIVASGVLKRLRVLDLRHGPITDAGVRALAGCPDLKNLELLDLSGNLLTEAGARRLQAVGFQVDPTSQGEREPGEDPRDNIDHWQADIE
jgi:uncharacterized protein (TIGR02996 family)